MSAESSQAVAQTGKPKNNIDTKEVARAIQHALDAADKVILGKKLQIKLSLACIISRGHLLIEDQPGMGKTTLAHVLAKVMGLEFHRVQFTSDLLPADILGSSIYDKETGQFKFLPGPIFSQMLLADEVNRATPKAQSALLEAMEEYQVTIEGNTYQLPKPFFVIATQNPIHQIGTFPLPESQLDRFLMRISMGYPDQESERDLLAGRDRRDMVANLSTILNPEQILSIQALVPQVHVSDALLDYVQALLAFSRQSKHFTTGLSPRGGVALIRAAQAWALLHNRNHVLPEDVQTVLPAVAGHRLQGAGEFGGQSPELLAEKLASVPIP